MLLKYTEHIENMINSINTNNYHNEKQSKQKISKVKKTIEMPEKETQDNFNTVRSSSKIKSQTPVKNKSSQNLQIVSRPLSGKKKQEAYTAKLFGNSNDQLSNSNHFPSTKTSENTKTNAKKKERSYNNTNYNLNDSRSITTPNSGKNSRVNSGRQSRDNSPIANNFKERTSK